MMTTMFDKSTRKKLRIIIAAAGLVISMAVCISGYFYYLFIDEDEIQVHFINAGQGDAALILTKSSSILIDCGTIDAGEKVAAYVGLRTDTVDYMILSHPHEDHIGGARYVFDKVNIRNVIMPDFAADSLCFDKLIDSIEKENCNVYPANRGDVYSIDGVNMEILSPSENMDYDDANNVSVVMKVTYRNTSFLFMGDAEKDIENDILANELDVRCNVLKAGHHGSSTSSTDSFIKEVSPDIAVISCGWGNSYGHPHRETIETFKKYGVEVLRTDILDSIVLVSDGNTVTHRKSLNSILQP